MQNNKLRTIKLKLSKIIKDKLYIDILIDACDRCNKLTIYTYQFLRLWILHKYHNKLEIPKITEDIIMQVMKVLLTESNRGAKTKAPNKTYQDEFNNFYVTVFSKLNNSEKINGLNLSNIIDEISTDILKNIENNIKLNYIFYIRRFVNSSFKLINNEIINKAKNKQIPVFKVNGSLNISSDISVNTITPIPKPSKREGHISPPNANTKFFTDCMNINEIGIPINTVNHMFCFKNSNLS